jgi:hypothetical protein
MDDLPRPEWAVATRRDRKHAAELARRILEAMERGELEADSPAARRLARRLEGAASAWEVENEISRPTKEEKA